jgi:tRNA1(Val) A37 N6-methylase TrmN6
VPAPLRRTAPDTPSLRKGRGAFFTPPAISSFLVEWAVRSQTDRVFEPSCGDASFLVPAAQQLLSRGADGSSTDQLQGVDVHAPSARTARRRLREAGFPGKVGVRDFFDVEPSPTFDAVVGNPPYIRYQNFTGDLRAKSLRAALSQGVRLTRLASSWAAFVVHASRFLAPGGRLGLVLPAELLSVNYAAPVRRFLLKRFAQVRLVMFEELVFPGVLEEVVLLLAEGEGSASCFQVYQAGDVSDLERLRGRRGPRWNRFAPEGGSKWTPALLSADAFAEYRSLIDDDSFCELLDWGETYLGAVTGNNGYFALSRAEARRLRIPKADLLPISPPGSKHLRGLSYTKAAWESAGDEGARCYLFHPKRDRLSAASANYVDQGAEEGVQSAYKCRVREPWWRVPVVPEPDLLLTYMDHDRPRLLNNAAGVAHLNSIYGVLLKPELRKLGKGLLPIATLNSVTLLGAEIVGRSYGGGLLKLEPKEADRLPVPSPALLAEVAPELRALRPMLTRLLARGELWDAIELVDQVLLRDRLALREKRIEALRKAREILFTRRTLRARTTKKDRP